MAAQLTTNSCSLPLSLTTLPQDSMRSTRSTCAGPSKRDFISLDTKKAFLPCDHFEVRSTMSKQERRIAQKQQSARFKELQKGPPRISKEKAALLLAAEVAAQAALETKAAKHEPDPRRQRQSTVPRSAPHVARSGQAATGVPPPRLALLHARALRV